MSIWSRLFGKKPSAYEEALQADGLRPIPDGVLPPMPSGPVDLYDSIEGQSKSLMHKQRVLCNGEASGIPCKHYWTLVQIASSAVPTHMKNGERTRSCILLPNDPQVMDEGREGMAASCNRYEPDQSPHYDTRGYYKDEMFDVSKATKRAYDPREEGFDPMSPAIIKLIDQGKIGSFRELEAAEALEAINPPVKEKPVELPPQTVSITDAIEAQEKT